MSPLAPTARVGALLLGVAVAACSPTPAASPTDASTDASTLRDASPPRDASPTTSDASPDAPDAGVEDAAPDATAPLRGGSVFAISESTRTADGGIAATSRVGAYFVDGPSTTDHVVERVFGPCVAATISPGTGSPGSDVAAGVVTVTGGRQPVTLGPLTDGTYPTKGSSTQELWSGGEALHANATGSVVPPFDADLVAPSLLTVTAPTRSSDAGARAPLDVPRGAPFDVTWTGTSSGSLVVYFAVALSSEARTVTCVFSTTGGTAQVPTAALATLPSGSGSFDVYVRARATPAVAGWAISFVATRATVDVDGYAMTGTAILR